MIEWERDGHEKILLEIISNKGAWDDRISLGCGLWAELIEEEGEGFGEFDDIESRDLQNDADCFIL